MTSFLSPCFFGYSAKTTKTGFCAGWLEIMFCFSLVRNVQIPLWIDYAWQTHDCQRHVGGEEGNRWKEETRKQGISPGDEVGWELIAARTREERENLTIKKREVGTHWCLFFSWEGNSHRGVGSHGNSSLDECVCGDMCVCVDGL